MLRFVLIAAVWGFVIAWLARGRARAWTRGIAVAVVVALTVAFVMPEIVRAKQRARVAENRRQAIEQQANAILRESIRARH
jgi:hypothetical protein